jgi:hypothetical protein
MQPNPGDTTNDLIIQLIKIAVDGPSAVKLSDFSSSTGYSSSTAWMQALAYASLSFSVLAAFGAVMGKQWLNSYKAARGRGSLQERGMQRQRKLDGLDYWQLQAVLKAFLVLLQISLFLFGFSLSMWVEQTTISSIIGCITAFGVLFYGVTVFVSGLRPDSPFQTAGSALVAAVCRQFFPPLTHDTFAKSSAIRWILETSTNPDVVEAAAEMVPLAQWPLKSDASAMYTRLRDTFTTYHDRPKLFMKCGKAMAHLCSQSTKINTRLLWKEQETLDAYGGKRPFIRDAFSAASLAWGESKMADEDGDKRKHKANARTALRTMVVHGLTSRLSLPDDEMVTWRGDLQWYHTDGRTPRCEDFDWLVDYLMGKLDEGTDEATQGDALLALSAMHGLGSSTKRSSYVAALIRCMAPSKPSRVRNATLRAIFDARGELASITSDSMPQGVDAKLLDELSRCTLSAAVSLDCEQSVLRSICYVRLIFSLARNDEWCQRLVRDGHIQHCNFLAEQPPTSFSVRVYLIGIFTRINPLGNNPSSPDQKALRKLMTRTWSDLSSSVIYTDDFFLEALPALVTATRRNFLTPGNDVTSDDLQALLQHLQEVLEELQEKRERRWFLVTPDGIFCSGESVKASDIVEQVSLP